MIILGIIIAVGAAIAFLVIGVLTLLGGSDATNQQILPGFVPDRPSLATRLLTLLAVWGPLILVALLCLLAFFQILSISFRAFAV